jgi:hypothetical protein
LKADHSPFRVLEHNVDLCVVGGGMAGVCAAVAAARRGAKVVLMQDRPVLGGNASGEIGVHIVGADRNGFVPYARETGLLEEILLDNVRRNRQHSLQFWDLVLYNFVRYTPNLELLLNCSCLDASMDPSTSSGQVARRIKSITGWQLTTQTWHKVEAKIFADCSGDAILSSLSGAEVRMGREARSEFGESFAPEEGDDKTMGMCFGWYAHEHDKEVPFVPFDWARKFEHCHDLPWGADNHKGLSASPWWAEIGGEHHSVHDTELLRDEIFAFNLGLWDHIKNGNCEHRERAKNWGMDRITFVPGRRESYRYVGLHVLSQNEISEGGNFDDAVGHGGWTMDDHHPSGGDSFKKHNAPPTIHHPAPSPYGFPYRSLVAKNIDNLMFAGRVASCTHVAMSSTRVMGTCAMMGQAVGTAAALAVSKGIRPAEVLPHIRELQQQLLEDDVFIPGLALEMSELTRSASLSASQGNPEPVRDGINRPVSADPFVWQRKPAWSRATEEELAAFDRHSWQAKAGDWIAYEFETPRAVEQVTLVLDSNLEREFTHPNRAQDLPPNMPKAFTLEIKVGGTWETFHRVTENHLRHLKIPVRKTVGGIRLRIDELHAAETTDLYGFYLH